jgi:hypothetical protein
MLFYHMLRGHSIQFHCVREITLRAGILGVQNTEEIFGITMGTRLTDAFQNIQGCQLVATDDSRPHMNDNQSFGRCI